MLFKVVNDLIVDVVVGLILATIKAIAKIEKGISNEEARSRNVFSDYDYGHWERTVLWLEDILNAKFNYLESQVKFITALIGAFYGLVTSLLLILLNQTSNFDISGFGILGIGIIIGILFGLAGGKSISDRRDIFNISKDEFKGDHFDS